MSQHKRFNPEYRIIEEGRCEHGYITTYRVEVDGDLLLRDLRLFEDDPRPCLLTAVFWCKHRALLAARQVANRLGYLRRKESALARQEAAA